MFVLVDFTRASGLYLSLSWVVSLLSSAVISFFLSLSYVDALTVPGIC